MALLGLLVLTFPLVGFALQGWVSWLLRRHGADRPDLPGTGGELARHLLDAAGLHAVPVEVTNKGDHYDPTAKVVRLRQEHAEGRSLTAVAVAAHECAHAVQDAEGWRPLRTRTRLAGPAMWFDAIGRWAAFAIIVAAGVLKVPSLVMAAMALGFVGWLVSVAAHLTTLPVDFDASFGRALPALERLDHLSEADVRAARRILRTCALTYVAGALVSLLNVYRWVTPWRR